MSTANLYENVFDQAFQGKINWVSDAINCALMSSGYTPNLATDVHWSDISAHETTGTAYSAGGVALGTKTHVPTAANSWGTSAATSTAYTYGQIVRPATGNGYVYRCVVAGTSGGSAPTWPTVVGTTVTDGSVTWVNAGESVSVFSSASASWTSSTISASYAVLYDAQTGTSSTEPLIAVINIGALASSNGTFTVPPDAVLGWFALTPA